MNKFRATLFLALTGVFLATNGCKKDQDDPIQDLGSNITVFTNQTGEPNETAQGLQAQVIDNNNGSTVDFYGGFSSDGRPNQVNSIRVTRAASDTVVNFIMNSVTGNFERAVFEVNGQRLNKLVKYDFPAGDTSMVLSHYNYNWSTGESELTYSGEYYLNGGTPIYVGSGKTDQTQVDWGALAVSIGLAAVIVPAGIAVGTYVVAQAAAVTAFEAATVGTALLVAALTSMNSHADELTPQNTSTPEDTPPNNTENEVLPEPLPPNPCLTNRVEVIVGINPGNVLGALAQGGTYGPYNFYWSNGATGTANTYHSIQVNEPGTYYATAIDENNCAGAGFATIGLSTIEKLIQWGPWRTQDQEIENNNQELVMGFITLSFSGLDCDCIAISNYEYSNIATNQYELVRTYDFCIAQGLNDTSFLFDESPCTATEAVLTVSSISEQGAVLHFEGGDVSTCVPF